MTNISEVKRVTTACESKQRMFKENVRNKRKVLTALRSSYKNPSTQLPSNCPCF